MAACTDIWWSTARLDKRSIYWLSVWKSVAIHRIRFRFHFCWRWNAAAASIGLEYELIEIFSSNDIGIKSVLALAGRLLLIYTY